MKTVFVIQNGNTRRKKKQENDNIYCEYCNGTVFFQMCKKCKKRYSSFAKINTLGFYHLNLK